MKQKRRQILFWLISQDKTELEFFMNQKKTKKGSSLEENVILFSRQVINT